MTATNQLNGPEALKPENIESLVFSPLDLEGLESLDELPATNVEIVTSMRASRAPDKAMYLLQSGFNLPEPWVQETADGSITVQTENLACIHVLYTLASKIPVMQTLMYDMGSGAIDEATALTILGTINTWIESRIETTYGWRNSITVDGKATNVEAYHRKNGSVVNTAQQVNLGEMMQIKRIFMDRINS